MSIGDPLTPADIAIGRRATYLRGGYRPTTVEIIEDRGTFLGGVRLVRVQPAGSDDPYFAFEVPIHELLRSEETDRTGVKKPARRRSRGLLV